MGENRKKNLVPSHITHGIMLMYNAMCHMDT